MHVYNYQGITEPNANQTASALSRATFLSLIVGMHALAVLALMSLGGRVIVDRAMPLLVTLMPAQSPPRPAVPMRTIPLPPMLAPEIHLPNPPPIENLFTVKLEEKMERLEADRAPLAAVAAPSAHADAPSINPPRFDLAYLDNPAPRYPAISRRGREEGRVMLRVRVSDAGTVEAIDVQASSGFARLDEAALAAVRRWRFVPARSGGQPVAGWAIVPIHFQLTG